MELLNHLVRRWIQVEVLEIHLLLTRALNLRAPELIIRLQKFLRVRQERAHWVRVHGDQLHPSRHRLSILGHRLVFSDELVVLYTPNQGSLDPFGAHQVGLREADEAFLLCLLLGLLSQVERDPVDALADPKGESLESHPRVAHLRPQRTLLSLSTDLVGQVLFKLLIAPDVQDFVEAD